MLKNLDDGSGSPESKKNMVVQVLLLGVFGGIRHPPGKTKKTQNPCKHFSPGSSMESFAF